MRVGFNARLLTAPTLRGFNRYAVNLLIELAGLGIELWLYSESKVHESHLERLPAASYELVESGPINYLLWEQKWLASRCSADRIDIFHSPFNFGIPWFAGCPTILTLHDAIDHVYYKRERSVSNRLSAASLKSDFFQWTARTSADRILTVSAFSRQDLISHLHIPPEKITVILEAADPRFAKLVSSVQKKAVLAKYNLRLPYFLYTGGWERRKNIPYLIEAFFLADSKGTELVLAGGASQDEHNTVKAHLDRFGIGTKVRLLGWIPDEDLPALYSSALSFVYPSEYEGFGLQLCEAMASGCPILSSNRTSLPEILGDGGEVFDIEDANTLAILLGRVENEPGFKDQLSERSSKRGHMFSWQETALRTVEVYKDVMHKHRAKRCQNELAR